MALASKTFRIFVSSTFDDLKEERNALQKEVFPKLRDLCMQHGYRFQAIDLRWGVRNESALDQQTMNICLDEVARCQRPPNPNFIVLLGDRYGWQPLPVEIPATEYEQIEQQISNEEDKTLLREKYKRDDNAVPAVYCLQPREVEVKKNATDIEKKTAQDEERKLWNKKIEPSIHKILRNAIKNISLTKEQKLKYISSATEQEIEAGALNVPDAKEHVFGFFRKIEKDIPQDESAKDYIDLIPKREDWQLDEDAQRKLSELKEELSEKTSEDNIFEYNAKWEGNGVSDDHIQKLCDDVRVSLSKIIEKEISLIQDKSPLEQEIDAHEDFGKERSEVFVGRVEILNQIQTYISRADNHPLAVYGESGTGKSTLMAYSIQQTQEKHPDTEVISRFIGVTPESSDCRALLESLCHQISKSYGNDESAIPSDYKELIEEFPKLLALATAEKPLILYLDALDQLSDADNSRNLIWLPAELPENVQLLVSTLPGECYKAIKGKLSEENIRELQPMPSSEGEELLNLWFNDAKRALQVPQRKEILDNFSREGNGNPLYLKLAFEESRRWKSYTKKTATTLSLDIEGIINNLFNRLSSDENHGEMMVSRCLGYIAAGKNGLSEDELLDVLSTDQELYGWFLENSHHIPSDVMEFLKIYIKKHEKIDLNQNDKEKKEISDKQAEEWYNNKIKEDKNWLTTFLTSAYKESHYFRIPIVLWSRLYFDLEAYLTERSADGVSLMAFYHSRSFGDAVHSTFLSLKEDKLNRHRVLAKYFEEQLLEIGLEDKTIPNLRKLSELPFQQTYGERWDDVTETLCDLDFIQAKCSAGMTYDLVNDFNATLESIPDNAENIRKEKERQSRLDKYAKDLVLYSKGEIKELEFHESITPWSEEKINAEIERIKTNPGRADSLKDFYNFLGHEIYNLQKYALEIPHLATQQAWNYADSGFVGEAAEKKPNKVLKRLLLRTVSTRPSWNLRPLALKILKRHTDQVIAVDITPDGKIAISGSADNTCILWNLGSGMPLKTLKGHTKTSWAVAITPDGKMALSGSLDKTCILWDLESGMPLKTLKGHTYNVKAVAITPDGKMALSGSDDKTCILWDLESGRPLKTLKGHINCVTAVAITPDGKMAISGSEDKTCILWDLESGRPLKALKGHTKWVEAVAITPDGKLAISGSNDKTCILWDLESGRIRKTLKGHTRWVWAVAITPDGKMALSGSDDKTCILWDLESGRPFKILKGHTESVWAVAITPDGKLAISGSRDKTCISWDLERGRPLKNIKGHTSLVRAVAITPDGKMAISGSGSVVPLDSNDYTCILWDLESGISRKILKGHTKWVEALAITPDGKMAISGSEDKTCIIWNLKNGRRRKTLKGHTFNVKAVAITPDGKMAISGSKDHTCILWNLKRGRPHKTFVGHTKDVNAVAITPDGKMMLSGSLDKTCILWDLESGRPCKILKGHTGLITAVAITPDGKMAISGSRDKTCILWDLESGMPLKTLKGHTSPVGVTKMLLKNVTAVAITPDGKMAISGSEDHTCILWNLKSGMPLKTLKGHTESVLTVAITPDGKMAISGSDDKTCIFWDLESGEKLAQYFTTSGISTITSFHLGFFGGSGSGETFILHAHRELLCPSIGITTARQIWDFKFKRFQLISADCPFCGNRFSPPKSVLDTIEEITKNAGLLPEQSQCLELPEEVWKLQGLLTECPQCGEDLKFNPFTVDSKEQEEVSKTKEAMHEFRETIPIYKDNASAYCNLGTVYLIDRKYEEAIEEYKIAIQIKVDHTEAHFNIGLAYKKLGIISEAKYHFTRAFELGFKQARSFLDELE